MKTYNEERKQLYDNFIEKIKKHDKAVAQSVKEKGLWRDMLSDEHKEIVKEYNKNLLELKKKYGKK